MINEPLKLTVEQVTALSPTIFSVRRASAEYKNYCTVELLVESRQVFLCDTAQRSLQFDSEEKATAFCHDHWPDAVQSR